MVSKGVSSRKRTKKQTRLTFTPLRSSSPQRPEAHVRLDDVSTPSHKRRRTGGMLEEFRELSPEIAQAIALSKQQNIQVVLPSPQANSAQLPTPQPSSQINRAADEGPFQDSEVLGSNTTRLASSIARGRSDDDDEESNIESDEEAPRKVRRTTRSAPIVVGSSSDDDSEPITPVKKRMPRGGSAASIDSSSDDSTNPKPSSSRCTNARSFLAGGSSGNAPVPRPNIRNGPSRATRPKSSRKKERKPETSGEDSDSLLDEMALSSPAKRTNKRRSEKQREEDEDSLLDELEDLKDTEEEPRNRRGLPRPKSLARSERLNGLARLKQRRAGIIEVESESEVDGLNGDHDGHEFPEDSPVAPNMDEYESDFVEDDGEIGVDLMKHGVPLHLTGHANKKPFDYFKDEIEWMVHNKLDPAFERHDEIYDMAHRKLDDEIKGLAGSEFNSSVWKEDFINALKSRPEMASIQVGLAVMQDKCEACNRSKHPPKWSITFSGNTYDKASLERIHGHEEPSSSSSSEDDDDEEAEPDQSYAVGSVCCGNAVVAHNLYHWRYQLNQSVLLWLSANGHTTLEKIIERERWNRKKREKLANKVVDGMLKSGEMKDLYLQFKQNVDAARASKADHIER